MKKIIILGVREQAEYFCDRHPKRRAYADLKTQAWYGSIHDLTGVEVHLCDECLEQLLRLVKRKFKIAPTELSL